MAKVRKTKDGLRAKCRRFIARSNYAGAFYINCEAGNLRFGTKGARDAYYMAHCCGTGEGGCLIRRKEDNNVHTERGEG